MSLQKKWYINIAADGNGYLLSDDRKPDAAKHIGKIKEVSIDPK